jgi:hypothetical protein
VLVAFSKSVNKFVFYDLDRLVRHDKKSVLFEKQFAAESVIPEHLYGMSGENKYFYAIENNKMLKFFKVVENDQFSELKLVGDIYLYCKPRCVTCSEEFIGLSMADRKLISYLIGDSDRMEETMARVKKLPSRYLESSNFFVFNF